MQEFNNHTLISSYIQIAAVHYSLEEADVRVAWTLNSLLGTVVDDIFDIDGSTEELHNFIDLLTKYVSTDRINCMCVYARVYTCIHNC